MVAASLDEVAKVMVEGESGLLAVARRGERPRWIASRGVLEFPSGALGFAYSAERPNKLRGPQHHYAWCDELAKWPAATGPGPGKGEATFDNLMLGLRLGEAARTVITTTPQPSPLLKRVLTLPRVAETRGRTDENPHLPADFRAAMEAIYGGSRLGRQELDGVLFDDPEGALWTREGLERARVKQGSEEKKPPPGPLHEIVEGEKSGEGGIQTPPPALAGGGRGVALPWSRVVIGLDPPASANGDACGLVVAGADASGVAYVIADLTASGLSPEGWARLVAAAARDWEASLILAEKNQGGEMVEAMLRGVDAGLPVRLVAATRAKAARAEPVALAFETGRARLMGAFPELEDQLCALTYKGFAGAGSPDRLDAMVWALDELLRPGREPRVRAL